MLRCRECEICAFSSTCGTRIEQNDRQYTIASYLLPYAICRKSNHFILYFIIQHGAITLINVAQECVKTIIKEMFHMELNELSFLDNQHHNQFLRRCLVLSSEEDEGMWIFLPVASHQMTPP